MRGSVLMIIDYVASGDIIWLWTDYLCKPRSKARDLQSCGVWAHYETLVAQAMSTLSRNSGSFHSLGLFPSRRQRSLKPVKRFINFAVVKKTQSGPREPSSSPEGECVAEQRKGQDRRGQATTGTVFSTELVLWEAINQVDRLARNTVIVLAVSDVNTTVCQQQGGGCEGVSHEHHSEADLGCDSGFVVKILTGSSIKITK